jgi:hydrogenase 3 maturation protease
MQKPHLLHALKKALGAEAPPDPARLVVLGVGSELRSDDAAGLLVAAALNRIAAAPAAAAPEAAPRHAPSCTGLHVLEAGPAPENCTAEIRRISPSFLIIVDCAHMDEAPGTLRIFTPSEIAGVSFGTHGLPLSVLAGYLRSETGCAVAILGIQPSNVDFGQTVSASVEASVDEAVGLVCDFLSPSSFFSLDAG